MEIFAYLKAELNRRCPQLEVREQEPMSRHTSFRIGGPAALMALPKSEEEAAEALRTAREAGVEPFFLGNGSNLLVSDKGVDCFVIKIGAGFDSCRVEGNTVIADCGITLARLACFARDKGLTGLEFAHGIPGCLGGAATMNAGAYGGEMSQVIRKVICLDRQGKRHEITDFDYGYRHSVFSSGDYLVTSVEMELQPGDPKEIRARMEELSAKRQEKQPLEFPSAGSVFKRPEGHFAGALVESSGLKGLTVGGAQVSPKHAGFIVNVGGATCADVLELVRQIQEKVLADHGVKLEMEIKVLGATRA